MPNLSRPRFRFGAQLSIGLSMTGLAVVHRDAWWKPNYSVLLDIPLDAGQIEATLQTELKQAAFSKLSARIVLDDSWVRYFMVAPPKNASNMDDCSAAVNMKFNHLYGESPQAWQISAAWDARQSFLACALPHSLLTTLQQAAQVQKLNLLRITPHFIACWNKWQPEQKNLNAWFGVVHGGQLSLGAVHQGRLKAIRRSLFTNSHWEDKQYLPTHLQREALRLSLPPPSQLVLCGDMPNSQHNNINSDAKEMMGELECKWFNIAQPPWLPTLDKANAEGRVVAGIGAGADPEPLSDALALAALGVRK